MDGQLVPGISQQVLRHDIFFGESYKVFLYVLYKGLVLWFLGSYVWQTHIILVKMDLPILVMHNIVSDNVVHTYRHTNTKTVT